MPVRTESRLASPGRALQFLLHLSSLLRLYWRLLQDPRVSIWPKALVLAALAYVALPFDILPDVMPFIGEIDDLAIVLAATHWFVRWCPPEVVREHTEAIGARRAS